MSVWFEMWDTVLVLTLQRTTKLFIGTSFAIGTLTTLALSTNGVMEHLLSLSFNHLLFILYYNAASTIGSVIVNQEVYRHIKLGTLL